MARRSEDELFQRFRDRREPSALAEVFDRVSPDLMRIALHLCGRTADAEDLVQQTFLAAIERAAAWDAQRGLFPWLVGILTNQASLRRRAAARVVDPARLVERQAPDPRLEAERAELDAAVARATAELGEVYRPVLHLHLHHGLNAKEIGAALGRPAGTVRTQLVRGLELLRRALPVGLGVVAAVTLGGGRGLAAVRAVVLEKAMESAGAASAGAVAVGGVLFVKKLLLVPAVLLFGLGLWAWLPDGDVADASRGAEEVPGAALREARDRTSEPAATATADGAPARFAAATGSLRVRVRGQVPAVQQVSVFETSAVAVSGEGVALPGVTVEFWPGDDAEPPVDATYRCTRTDAIGEASWAGLPPGAGRVRAAIGSWQSPTAQVVGITVAAGQPVEVELVLDMTASVRGRVVDEAGVPVAGAEVWAGTEVLGVAGAPDGLLRRAAISGPDGSFALLHARSEGRIAARKSGYAASWSHATQTLGEGDIELVLERGPGTLAGTVVDPRGMPVADAVVVLQLEPSPRQRAPDGRLLAQRLPLLLRTDARGRFVADDLAPGSYRCLARARPLRNALGAFTVAAFGHASVQLTLGDAVTVDGAVVDGQGQPLEGVWVWLSATDARGRQSTQTAKTRARGRFVFQGAPAPPFTIAASRHNAKGATRVRQEVRQVEQRFLSCRLVLEERPGIRGRVVGSERQPLPGWQVAAVTAAGEATASVTTAGDGGFDLRDLAPGAYRVVAHEQRGAVSRTPDAEQPGVPPGTEGLELRALLAAPPRASIRGRIVGAGRRAPAGAGVSLARSEVSAPPGQVDADGRFAFECLTGGEFTLTYGAFGCQVQYVVIRLATGEARDLGDLLLEPEAGLRVRFRRPDGRPWHDRPPVPLLVDAAGDWIAESWRAYSTARVDYAVEGGELVVRRLAPGRYTLHPPQGDELVWPPREVELRTGETARVEIQVAIGRRRVLAFAKPPAPSNGEDALHLEVRTAKGELALRERLPRGLSTSFWPGHTFLLGSYEVTAHTDSGARYRASFVVGESRDEPIRVEVPLVEK